MKPQWKNSKKFKPKHLLKKLNESSSVDKDGKVSFSNFYVTEIAPSLYSMIDFPDNSCFDINHSYLERSIFSLAAKGDITPQNLIDAISELFSSENQKKEKIFYLLTHISIDFSLTTESVKIGKSNINFSPSGYPKQFTGRDKAYQRVQRFGNKIQQTPNEYLAITIETKSKHEHLAVEQCLSDLDLLRAVWLLFANTSLELFGANWKPINKVRRGSYHTLHHKNGEVTNLDTVWYDPSFTPAKIYTIQNEEQKSVFMSNVRWIIEQLEKCKYSTYLSNSLVRYASALDEADANVAFLKLWGALESLVSMNEPNNDKLPKRCAILFKDREYHQQILEHLREYRNQNIHSGFQSNKAKTYCYQLQMYFREVIFFHMRSVEKLDTLDEAHMLLDLPADINELKKKQKLLDIAIKCRSEDTNNE